MITTLGLIISGGSIGGLLLWLVGLIIAVCIIIFIMKQLNAPAVAYTALYVIIAVIALLLVIDFFFGGRGGAVIIRN